MANINIQVIEAPQIQGKVVALTGEMDEPALEVVKPNIDPLLTDVNNKKIVFNLSGLTFINSKGIGYLVSVHTHLSKDQRVLALAAANEVVMDVIQLVGLTSIVPYYNTVEEALQ